MAIWFTSDTHFNHENIISHSCRSFRDLAEMESVLVSNWNKRVKPGDTVYHLGDFALSWGKKHSERIDGLLSRLQGQKWLIIGNHDRDEVTKNKRWNKVVHYHEIKVDLGGEHKQRIVMCHYAMRVWNQWHRGSWMLHGHSHGSLIDVGGKTLDVGVDPCGYKPISIDQIAEVMALRPIALSETGRG